MKKRTLEKYKKEIQSFLDKGYSLRQVIDRLNIELEKHKPNTSQYRNIQNHIVAAESFIDIGYYFPNPNNG